MSIVYQIYRLYSHFNWYSFWGALQVYATDPNVFSSFYFVHGDLNDSRISIPESIKTMRDPIYHMSWSEDKYNNNCFRMRWNDEEELFQYGLVIVPPNIDATWMWHDMIKLDEGIYLWATFYLIPAPG